MREIRLVVFLLIHSLLVSAQQSYPTDYFASPLEIPLILSGTFGELRSNHFHAGLDIKTQKKEGFNVLASAEGYVSRINVSLWGYGNALYITHPNGYTTVYAHLKSFSPEIDAYVRKHQYKNERFTIRLYPKADELKVDKGEVIALSGNSGSSGGPHLHFEIRDVKSNILNPFQFGFNIPDHKQPTIQSAIAYPLTKDSHVNRSSKRVSLVLKRNSKGDLQADPVYAVGKVGFGINAFDRLDGALNRNGLYRLEMEVNGVKMFDFKADKFAFSESRFINSFIDYERYIDLRQRVQKCFVDHEMNNLSLYKKRVNQGFITVKDSLEYNVRIIASDYKGNKTRLIIPIKGKMDSIVDLKPVKKTPYYFRADKVNSIKDSTMTAYFPKDIFYESFYFDYENNDGVVKLHNNTVPVHKNFRLTFLTDSIDPEELKYTYIARKNKYGKLSYVSTNQKDKNLYTLSKVLGEYTLQQDKDKPTISPVGFKDGQWLTKFSTLKVKIRDKGSGIKSFRGEIDGKWIRMALNPKTGVLTYDFSDKQLEGTLHTLKVVVKDNVNNSTTLTITFNKKN